MNIIQFMDMKSTKYGGLGKFMVKLMECCPNDKFHFVFQSYPESKEMIRDFEEHGAVIDVVDTSTGKFAIKNIPQFIKILKKSKPDIIHFHFANSFFVYAPIAKLFGVKKLFKTQHCCLTTDDSTQITDKKQFNLRTKIFSWDGNVYRLFDAIVMCGDYVKSQFERIYGKSGKYKRIYFGVTPVKINSKEEKENLRKTLQIEESDIVISTIAFADPIKGLDVLIKAIPYIEFPNFKVVIVGVNPALQYGSYLQYLAKSLGVNDYIRWIGITDRVNDYLSISDIYCQPSRSEALTLAVCEAKSAHLPIVGSNVGGLPEISNVLFENEDSKGLAHILSDLLVDDKKRSMLAEKSYMEFCDNFEMSNGVKEYAKLYNS